MYEDLDIIENPEDTRLNINLSLLRQLKTAVVSDPSSFDMGDWVRRGRGGEAKEGTARHPCFTEACIAGWAVFLAHDTLLGFAFSDIADEARRLLGITEEQASRLFHAGYYTPRGDWESEYWTQEDEDDYAELHWPREFSDQYIWRPKTRQDYVHNATVAANRIEHFINTLGATQLWRE